MTVSILKLLALIPFLFKWAKEIWSRKLVREAEQRGRDQVIQASETAALNKRIERLEQAKNTNVQSMSDEELNAGLVDPRAERVSDEPKP
jgi:hypothetical protein